MTSRNTRRAAGRSPGLRRRLDEAVGVPVRSAHRTMPGRPMSGIPRCAGRAGLPAPRATYDGPVQNADAYPATPDAPAGRLFRLTGRRARSHRRRGVTGSHLGLRSDVRRLSAGTPRVLAFRVHLAVDHSAALPDTPPAPPAPTRSTTALRPSVAFRRGSAVRARTTQPRDQIAAEAAEMRSRRTRILRGFGDRPGAVAGAWIATSRFTPARVGPGSVAGERVPLPVDVRDFVAPHERKAAAAAGSDEVFDSGPAGGHWSEVSRAANLVAPGRSHEVSDLPKHRQLRRRAIVLSGGVAAAVIAIVAVVVLALGQRSTTSPAANRGTDASTSTATPVEGTDASDAAVVETTAETSSPTAASVEQTATTQATAAAPRPTAPAPATNGVRAVTTPTSTTTPVPVAGVHDTATVVTGISKLTGWVPLSTPHP